MRPCACGCKVDLDALGKRRDAKYASSGHRDRARHGKAPNTGGAAASRQSPARRARRPDLRVNYRKAVEKLTEELRNHELVSPPSSARVVAEVWLRDLLSDAQRARLDTRDHSKGER